MKYESETSVQILEETVYASFYANSFGKNMNLSVLPRAMGQELFSLN